MIKLLAMDLDGTLLNAQSRISQKNSIAVQKCQDQGIKVAVVTGQALHFASSIIHALGLDSAHVVSNGALAVDPGFNKLYCQTLEAAAYQSVVAFCKKEEVQLLVSTADGRLVYDRDVCRPPNKHRMVKVPDLSAGHIARQALLCTIMTHESHKIDLQAGDISPTVKVRDAGLNYINIFDRKAGKTFGLKKIMAYFGLSAQEVMAIGDGENDLGMIKMAGIGVAMGNAEPKVKNCADFVTLEQDQNGLALALQKFLGI